MSLPSLPRRVTLVEVGPRDGLQNEAVSIPTPEKVAFVDRLSAAGLPIIEVTAFVRPSRVPQMADAEAVCRQITRTPGTRYCALVPNLQGLERAQASGVDEVGIFAAASETFSRRNLNASVEESLAGYRAVSSGARAAGMRVRAYLSTSFGCPFEGPVPATRVVVLAERLLELGASEVAISDTIGIAHPGQVEALLDIVLRRIPVRAVALHLHDTRGTALANVLMALQVGVTTFDAAAGGLGGCPYAPGASGNLATEDLLYMLDGLGIETGARREAVLEASTGIGRLLDHPLRSRYVEAERAARARRDGGSQ